MAPPSCIFVWKLKEKPREDYLNARSKIFEGKELKQVQKFANRILESNEQGFYCSKYGGDSRYYYYKYDL